MKEISHDKALDRIAEVEEILKDTKVKLPEALMQKVIEQIEAIKEKFENGNPIYEKDFNFTDKVKDYLFSVNLVREKYKENLEVLKLFNLYNLDAPETGDVPPPSMEEAMQILCDSITPEKREVIEKMEKATFQLIPITSMNRYIKALDSYLPMDEQIEAAVSPWHKDAFKRADERDGAKDDTIIGWKIAVTEGSKEPKLLDGDDVNKTLRERGAWFKQKFQRKGISGVDLKRMLALMMNALKNIEPLNNINKKRGTWTFVNEEPEKDDEVSGAGWWSDKSYNKNLGVFVNGGKASSNEFKNARFRTSVVVDVPR